MNTEFKVPTNLDEAYQDYISKVTSVTLENISRDFSGLDDIDAKHVTNMIELSFKAGVVAGVGMKTNDPELSINKLIAEGRVNTIQRMLDTTIDELLESQTPQTE